MAARKKSGGRAQRDWRAAGTSDKKKGRLAGGPGQRLDWLRS